MNRKVLKIEAGYQKAVRRAMKIFPAEENTPEAMN